MVAATAMATVLMAASLSQVLEIACVMVLVSFSAHADVTNITSTVDKNPVIANESFILTVTFNDDVPNSAFQPDILDLIMGSGQ